MVRPRHPSTSIGDTAWLLESASDHLAPPASHESDPLAAGAGDGEQIDEDSAARLTGRQKRILGGLSLGGLLAGCCIAVMIPLLAFPVMGRVAPVLGVTRLYNIGLAVAGAATVAFGMLPIIQDSMAFIAACLTCRALEAVGTAAMHTAARAIIINQFPDNPNTAMSVSETLRVALGITPAQLGLFFLVSSSCYTVSSLIWGRISDRVPNTYALTAPCLLVAALGILLIPPSPLLAGLQPAWYLLGLGMVIRETAIGGAYIPIMSRMVRVCVAHGMEDNLVTHSFVSAVFGAVFSIGNVVGPTLGGYITDLYGFPVAATGLAGFGVLVAIACVVGAVVTRDSLPK
ncbi:MFS-type transporter SLC18B1 [Amphibalanus amphitrite]|uniref:MFS-type transporter SLC18B1 n=1 Tax=Amphibalanus amphitrite TaxID=1232801 RepID=A0A6A4VAF2_AMPAM|nr:MFS-type transporter SLC18B1 [Amphibalanus amphitrite]